MASPPARPTPTAPAPSLRWDVFCRVIDNHGDLGVLWRLSAQLAQRGQRVRLWTDDARALNWMAPERPAGVHVLDWAQARDPATLARLPRADVWIEGFGCELPEAFVAHYSPPQGGRWPVWLNLEYLSAEPWVERCHLLPSPVMAGPARGAVKTFFFPGFTPRTGGLLREDDLVQRQRRFERLHWLARLGISHHDQTLISLFCYEPAGLPTLLAHAAQAPSPTLLLVCHGRPRAAVAQAWPSPAPEAPPADGSRWHYGALSAHFLPPLSQPDFDHLLWACDHNTVRGEDSLVRAIWAGKPLSWQLYPQEDGAHHAKLHAFLSLSQAPEDVAQWHRYWNAERPLSLPQQPLLTLPPSSPAAARARVWAGQLRQRLLAQDDLCTQLQRHVQAQLAGIAG